MRLQGGMNRFTGRVEICMDTVWGTICDNDNWDISDATVVCRQLGFSDQGLLILQQIINDCLPTMHDLHSLSHMDNLSMRKLCTNTTKVLTLSMFCP